MRERVNDLGMEMSVNVGWRGRNPEAHLPEQPDDRVVLVEQPTIVRMLSQVLQINRCIHTTNQHLHLLLVEHPEIQSPSVKTVTE